MADQSTADLRYGHFGQAIYNPDDQAWLYPRNLTSPPTLRSLAPSQLVFSSNHSHSFQEPAISEKPSVQLDRQLASLFTTQPTLVPAAHLLPQPAAVSREVQKTLLRYDPTLGRILAFGRIPDHATKRYMTIAAFPAADHPHILRLIQVQPQKHGWEHNKSVWLDVPRIYGDSGVWEAPAPIRQISFVDVEEDSNFARTFALRTTLGVHILRIAARKHLSSWSSLENTPSRFHVTQLCTLTLDLFASVAPAHVACNRWYPKQFATVDQQGTWRVWDTSIRQPPSEHGKPVELCRGATNDQAVPEEEASASLLDDGWGRVTWAGNLQTIVTASRKCLGIYDIQGKPVRLQSPNLAITGTPHWILDVQLNPLDPSLIFVLTSASLFCLRVRCLDEFDPESYSTAGAEVILQCRHFRDSEDIGLCLSSYVDDQDLVVLIKSSLSPLATSYRFVTAGSSPTFVTVTDATLVTLPEQPSKCPGLSTTLAFELQVVDYGESSHHGNLSGPGKAYRDIFIKFYVATVINSDMSIVQKLYYAIPSSVSELKLHTAIKPPDWRGRLIHSRPRLQDTGFVVDYAASKNTSMVEEEEPGAVVSPQVNTLKSAKDNWTMLYEFSHARATAAISQTEDFSQILARVKQACELTEDSVHGHKLLSEMYKKQILVSDIDQAAAEFKELLASTQQADENMREGEPVLLLSSIANSSALDIGIGNDVDPTVLYDNIIGHWLTPLSQTIPGRVRLVKEQLARRIAAEVCLASHVLRQPPAEVAEEETQQAETEMAASSQRSFPQSSLPTPSPTATPSLTTVTSLSSHPSTLVSSEFARLQRYVSFAQEKPTPAPLPKPLTNTLAHWSLGGNPDEYDWLSVQREQERRAEEEDEDLTPKERARLKRRAEKLLLKQRRESQKASAMDLASSQAPGILSASQPVLATPSRSVAVNVPQSAKAASQGTPLLASSQSQAQPNMFASQVQPGRFGGKPAKKKRKIGF